VVDPLWVWLSNDEQRIGLISGPAGRIRLPRLPLRTIEIRARYGTREARIRVRPPGSLILRLPTAAKKED
jgi:hypothetical protein